jgi:hypothetical protein
MVQKLIEWLLNSPNPDTDREFADPSNPAPPIVEEDDEELSASGDDTPGDPLHLI